MHSNVLMRKQRVTVAIAMALSFVLSAHGQGSIAGAAQSPLGENALSQVVVTASRSHVRIEQMPLHTTIVSQQDILRSAAQTLDQLLRDVPGFNFTGVPTTQSDPTGHSTKMRGMGNAKVLVLLDGVPMMDPFYLTTQWFKAPLSSIERVEVLRGGNSSLWGNMAVAGVVNIVTKRPIDGSGEASAGIGSRGNAKLALSKNLVVSDALSFNFIADRFNAKGYDAAPVDQRWRFPGKLPANAQDSNLLLTAYVRPASDLSGYLRLGYHVQDQDISYRFGNNLQENPDISGNLVKRLDDKSTLTGSAWAQTVRFEKYNGAGCYWQATASTKCPNTASVSFSALPAFNSDIVQYYTQYGSQRYREQGASAMYSKEIGGRWRSLQVGLDYRHLAATDLEYFFSAPTALSKLDNWSANWASSTYGAADQAFTGLFAQTAVVPTQDLELTASARQDRWSNTGRTNTRTLAGAQASGGAQPDNRRSGLNPSLAARYAIDDDLAARAAAYKSFRAPGFNNTTRTYGSPNPTIANPDLGPENLSGREIGVDFHRGALGLGATWFQYDIRDMIATYKVTTANAPALVQSICGPGFANCGGAGGSASFYTNDQEGASRGLELTAQWQLAGDLQFNAAYTRTSTVLTRKGYTSADPIGLQLAGVPKYLANAGLSWRAPGGVRASAQARYIGRMAIDTTSTPGVIYNQGAAVVVDASAQYALSGDADLSLSVLNLFDKDYSENAYSYNQPWSRARSMPRSVTLGVKLRF